MLESMISAADHKTEEMKNSTTEDKDVEMGDIAGLLALMQGNKNLDLPGLSGCEY